MVESYNIDGKYLYEILDDYKNSENKEEIFKCFMCAIWHSPNSRQIYTKYIRFTMLPKIINTGVGQVFYKYVNIPYITSKTVSKNTDYVSLIRQKINNLYDSYCESRLCVRNDYMKLLRMPKTTYYRWEKYHDEADIDDLENRIVESLDKAERLKDQYSKQKMKLTWKQFKLFAEEYLHKGFDNYIPLDEYENKNEFVLDTDLWTEDNFAIRYLCQCLQFGIRNEQKKYYGLYIKGSKDKIKYRRCVDCGDLIWVKNKDNQTTRCKECQHKRDNGTAKLRMRKYRDKNVTLTN